MTEPIIKSVTACPTCGQRVRVAGVGTEAEEWKKLWQKAVHGVLDRDAHIIELNNRIRMNWDEMKRLRKEIKILTTKLKKRERK